MANHAGKEGTVKVGSNTIAEIRSWTINETAETVDETTMGDSDRTHIFTVGTWEVTVSCWWDETDSSGQGALTRGASVTLNLFPEGASGGDAKFSGTATVTSIARSATLDGMVEVEFTAQGNGALTESTV